jgi:hypothetical protein
VTTPATRRSARPGPAPTRLAWALCVLSVTLAVAAVALATVNGENLVDLVEAHQAIGILDALVLSVVGALIVARDLSLPGGDLASWLATWTNVPGIVIGVVFLVLLFPDGRLPSRRWWPLAAAGVLITVVPTLILAVGYWPLRGPALVTQEGEVPPLVGEMFWIAFAGSLVLGAISTVALVLRFRRAGAVERQQIKWFAYGAVLSIPLSLFPEADPWGPYAELLGTVLLLAGLGVGILRYRLWDIDRLVNRTVVYGLVTVILGGAYALGVLVLGQAVGAGRSPSSLVVAGTTLVVAALFQPLRRRVQRAVDRRFDRRHYDAARTIEAFAARLRDHTDLHALSAELLAVADHTLQPTQVSLWLAQPPTWMAGLRRGSSSTSRSTSRVTGAVSPSPRSR